jgi:Protein of unknown function (DUF3592)
MNNYLFLIIASAGSFFLIFFGVKIFKNIIRLKKSGVETPGMISGLRRVIGANANTIYPEVTYKTNRDITITKNSNIGVIPGYYKLSQKVTIVYNENKPEIFIIKNNITFIVPVFMILIGLILIILIIYHFT